MGCMGLFVMEPRLLILCLRKIGETEPRGGGLGLLSPSRARTETIPLNRAPRNRAVCHRSERRGQPWGRQAQIRLLAEKRADLPARACKRAISQFVHTPRLWRFAKTLCRVRCNCPRPKHSTTTRCSPSHARGGAAHASPLTWCRRRGGASSLPPACQGVPSRRVRRQR